VPPCSAGRCLRLQFAAFLSRCELSQRKIDRFGKYLVRHFSYGRLNQRSMLLLSVVNDGKLSFDPDLMGRERTGWKIADLRSFRVYARRSAAK